MKKNINEGDRLDFYFFPSTLDEHDVKVIYRPTSTGDVWRVERKDGTIVIIQSFIKAIKLFIALAILLGAFSVDPAPAQACGGWWDPCCKWWVPSTCPSPVEKAKKDLAQKNADYFTNADYNLRYIAVAICPWFPETLAACLTAGAGAAMANQLARDQDKVSRDPWDENYAQPYDPPWPSVESLGLRYTGNYYLDNMIWYVQAHAQMADFIYVSGNRATSCDQSGQSPAEGGCGIWQRERVIWGLDRLGWILNEFGNQAWGIAYQVEVEGGADNLVGLLREMAWVSNDSGWRFQQ